MLSIVMLSVVMLSVVMLSVIMLSIVMLSVVRLNVMAPFKYPHFRGGYTTRCVSVIHPNEGRKQVVALYLLLAKLYGLFLRTLGLYSQHFIFFVTYEWVK
jgi:hypothetical protein